MSVVDGPTGTTVIQYTNMDQAIGAGDIEAVMLMLGIERASTAEDVVKRKITQIRENNAKIQDLNAVLEKIQGKDDKDNTDLGLTNKEVELLSSYGIKTGDYISNEDGKNTVIGDGNSVESSGSDSTGPGAGGGGTTSGDDGVSGNQSEVTVTAPIGNSSTIHGRISAARVAQALAEPTA